MSGGGDQDGEDLWGLVVKDRPDRACVLCWKTPGLLCPRCRAVRYCGRDCQHKAWKYHEKDCNQMTNAPFRLRRIRHMPGQFEEDVRHEYKEDDEYPQEDSPPQSPWPEAPPPELEPLSPRPPAPAEQCETCATGPPMRFPSHAPDAASLDNDVHPTPPPGETMVQQRQRNTSIRHFTHLRKRLEQLDITQRSSLDRISQMKQELNHVQEEHSYLSRQRGILIQEERQAKILMLYLTRGVPEDANFIQEDEYQAEDEYIAEDAMENEYAYESDRYHWRLLSGIPDRYQTATADNGSEFDGVSQEEVENAVQEELEGEPETTVQRANRAAQDSARQARQVLRMARALADRTHHHGDTDGATADTEEPDENVV